MSFPRSIGLLMHLINANYRSLKTQAEKQTLVQVGENQVRRLRMSKEEMSTTDLDELSETPDLRSSKYLINVEPSLRELLATEDTNRNLQLTIEDIGPKVSI